MTPARLAELVRTSAGDVLIRRGIDPAILPATVTVERPRNPAHGDYATNVALQAAGQAGVSPRELAGWLAEALTAVPGVRCVEVAGPGFLNLRLDAAVQAEIVPRILAAGDRFGVEEGRDTVAGSDHTGPDHTGPDHTGPDHTESDRTGPDHTDAGAGRPGGLLGAAAEYDVQYAHARLVALARNAADLGVTGALAQSARLELLEHEREGELIRMLGDFPRIAASGGPDRMRRYLTRLAGASHDLTDTCPVLPMGDEEPGPRHAARLALCQATRQVLANGLRLLGDDAAERM